jgi:hypothetical protein
LRTFNWDNSFGILPTKFGWFLKESQLRVLAKLGLPNSFGMTPSKHPFEISRRTKNLGKKQKKQSNKNGDVRGWNMGNKTKKSSSTTTVTNIRH